MAIKEYHLEILDLLSLDNDQQMKQQWINKISQQDLYSIASWLMMNLTEQSQGIEHKRSEIRGILNWYYELSTHQSRLSPWTDKQKWVIANAVINLWTSRRLDQDPRYQW